MNSLSRKQNNKGSIRQNLSKKNLGGFTLVEMIVSIGLFTVVLFIATSAFLTVVNADRKSRATRIATDNLNLALEDMQRKIRTGSSYYCGPGGESSLTAIRDCSGYPGDSVISFTEQDGVTRTTYSLGLLTSPGTPKSVYRYRSAGIPIPVTAPEISISDLKFFVQGSTPGDPIQPYVVIVIDGAIINTANPALGASFKIQTTVTQRNYDS